MILPNIWYQESNLHFDVLSFLNTKIEVIATSWRIKRKVITFIFVFHNEHFLELIHFNDAIDLIFVLVPKRVKIRGEIYLSHDNGKTNRSVWERLNHLRLKSGFDERIWYNFINDAVDGQSVKLVFKEFHLTTVQPDSNFSRIK